MKKSVKIIIMIVTIIISFSAFFIIDCNSYKAKVSESYSTVEYNNNIYTKIDSLPDNCLLDEKVKVYQNGNSVFSQWLVSPMCYVSDDKEYIKLITEDDTINSKVLYYKIDSINRQ